jgi:hypothetical protein
MCGEFLVSISRGESEKVVSAFSKILQEKQKTVSNVCKIAKIHNTLILHIKMFKKHVNDNKNSWKDFINKILNQM